MNELGNESLSVSEENDQLEQVFSESNSESESSQLGPHEMRKRPRKQSKGDQPVTETVDPEEAGGTQQQTCGSPESNEVTSLRALVSKMQATLQDAPPQTGPLYSIDELSELTEQKKAGCSHLLCCELFRFFERDPSTPRHIE